MKRLLAAAGGLLALAVFGGLAYLNPTEVGFQFSPGETLRLPLGWLLVLTFISGALLVVVWNSLRDLGRRLAGWRERRRVKEAIRVNEWHESGAALAWEGEVERGRTLLRRAWSRRPSHAAAALALATSYMDTAEYDAAREVLEEAVRQNAIDPDLRYALAESLRRSGEVDDAIRMLETVRVQHPHAPRALVTLRELYTEAGRWREAAQVQQAYLETLSDSIRPGEETRLRDLRYRAALAAGDPARRADALRALTETYRDFMPAALGLGDALAAGGRIGEARAVWEKAFKAHPDLPFIERLLANPEHPRDREKTLALLARHRQQLDPDGVHLLLARFELSGNDPDAAAAELRAIANQQTPAVQRCWADLHHRRGQHEEAWKILTALADGAVGE
jgi:tetratricopeptide (TPR) repeat protein